MELYKYNVLNAIPEGVPPTWHLLNRTGCSRWFFHFMSAINRHEKSGLISAVSTAAYVGFKPEMNRVY